MGWASGSQLAESIWLSIRQFIPKEKRALVARQIIEEFECNDCDTIDEAEILCKDAKRRAYWESEENDGEQYEPLDDENPTPK